MKKFKNIFDTYIGIVNKINPQLMDKIRVNRLISLEKLNQELKQNNPFINKPFNWVIGLEYYGLYEDISEIEYIINKKINKEFKFLEFSIRFSKSDILSLENKSDIDIQIFYKILYENCIKNILNTKI